MIIESVSQYLRLIELLQEKYKYNIQGNGLIPDQTIPTNFVFRGHGDKNSYKLIPGIFRMKEIEKGKRVGEFSQLEFIILFDFISEACGLANDIHPSDTVPWLEIAQHFGVPTRLLDFSGNPLVALYFACVDSPEKDASVWIIDENAYNRKFYCGDPTYSPVFSDITVHKIVNDEIVNQDFQQHGIEKGNLIFPWIYKPIYRNQRMISQSSIFMIWAAERCELTSFMKPDNYMTDDSATENCETGILCELTIPCTVKNELLKQLDMCGINEKFIYPGLDGIGRFIRNKYSYKRLMHL